MLRGETRPLGYTRISRREEGQRERTLVKEIFSAARQGVGTMSSDRSQACTVALTAAFMPMETVAHTALAAAAATMGRLTMDDLAPLLDPKQLKRGKMGSCVCVCCLMMVQL